MSRIVVQIILSVMVVILTICTFKARRSEKPIGRSVSMLICSLIPAIAGNIIIIGATEKQTAEIGMYIYFIGMDLIMAFLIKFTLDYCNKSWDSKLVISICYSFFTVDIIQLLLNPVFGHAFGTEVEIVEGAPYYKVVPYLGQTFHRVVIYGFLLASMLVFAVKMLRRSRIYAERYAVILGSMVFTTLWETFYIFSRTPVDTSMIGFGIFGILVFYFSLYYKPVFLMSNMLSSIVSGMQESIYFFSETGECIWANPQGREFLGITMNDLGQVLYKLAEIFPSACNDGKEWSEDHTSGSGENKRYYHLEKQIARDSDRKQTVIGSFVSVRDDTEAQLSLERERYAARHDSLTGLYNRDYMVRRIREMIDEHRDISYQVVFVDVNEFKMVNDVFGREFGDHALKTIAEWIRNDLSDLCVYGRISGDTFGVCMPVDEFNADKINEDLSKFTVKMGDLEHHVLIHMGICRIDDPEIEVTVMFDRARMALSKIKRVYSHIAYYNDSMREDMVWNQKISSQLDEAIEDRQIRPFLQPIVDTRGRIVGAEALARWLHPDKGLLSPAAFVPVFEHNGRIADIDRCIWRDACELLKIWEDKYPDLFISVNISPIDFYFMDIRKEIKTLVDEYEIDPVKLRLEITEAVMISNVEDRINTINQLREDGHIVEMDDFGSGYSSLNMLKDMPVDLIKLDMMFLRNSSGNKKARTILESVINMIERIGIDSLTEGVETAEQFNTLAEMGCKLFQGYYFAKPLPVEEFEIFCSRNIA